MTKDDSVAAEEQPLGKNFSISDRLYKVYGMTVKSEFELPELVRLGVSEPNKVKFPDVEIGRGKVPKYLPGGETSSSWVQVRGRTCLLRFANIARFLVEDGRFITTQLHPNATMDDMRGFLLGSAVAAAAHQRGLVPIHVSAALSPDGAIAFTGESGAGKSTIAAHVNKMTGWRLISDDVSGLYRLKNEWQIESGIHTVKLWDDALGSLGSSSIGLRRDLNRFDKFHAIHKEKFATGRHPLLRLIQLNWGETFDLSAPPGRQAFQIALRSIYRPELARLCGNWSHVVQTVMSFAASMEIHSFTRPEARSVEDGAAASVDFLLSHYSLAR